MDDEINVIFWAFNIIFFTQTKGTMYKCDNYKSYLDTRAEFKYDSSLFRLIRVNAIGRGRNLSPFSYSLNNIANWIF